MNKYTRSGSLFFYNLFVKIHLALGTRRFRLVRMVFAVWARKLKTDFAVVYGHKMQLDKGDCLALSLGLNFEPSQVALAKSIIKPGDTILDLGAHIGYYTLIFAKLVGEKGRVIAVEPDPENFAILKKNIELNGYNNVTFINAAAGDKSGILKLYRSKRNGDNQVFDSGESRSFVEARVVKLDDLVNMPVNFVKMNIRGAEGLALKGMKRIITDNQPLSMLMEFNPRLILASGLEAQLDVLQPLYDAGFKIQELLPDKNKLVQVTQETLKVEVATKFLFCQK